MLSAHECQSNRRFVEQSPIILAVRASLICTLLLIGGSFAVADPADVASNGQSPGTEDNLQIPALNEAWLEANTWHQGVSSVNSDYAAAEKLSTPVSDQMDLRLPPERAGMKSVWIVNPVPPPVSSAQPRTEPRLRPQSFAVTSAKVETTVAMMAKSPDHLGDRKRDRIRGPMPVLRVAALTTMKVPTKRISPLERACLIQAVYFEARGEPKEGQIAVAEVILNRVKSRRFPNSICDVVFEGHSAANRCQFSYVCDGLPELVVNEDLYASIADLVDEVLGGKMHSVVGSAQFFHNNNVRPEWASELTFVRKIGHHNFYASN